MRKIKRLAFESFTGFSGFLFIISLAYGKIPYSPLITCSDTDNGINIFEPGLVTVINIASRPSTLIAKDFCSDNETLVEFYCVKDIVARDVFQRLGTKIFRCSCSESTCQYLNNLFCPLV